MALHIYSSQILLKKRNGPTAKTGQPAHDSPSTTYHQGQGIARPLHAWPSPLVTILWIPNRCSKTVFIVTSPPLLFRYRGVVFVLEGEEFVESRTGSVELRVITVFDDGAVIHDVDTVHAA